MSLSNRRGAKNKGRNTTQLHYTQMAFIGLPPSLPREVESGKITAEETTRLANDLT